MLKNYFKIALRYFQRNKLYTAINIFGLAIGIAACLVIFLIVNFESNFDKLWKDQDRIYRVYSKFSGVYNQVNPGVPTGLGPWVKENVSGVDQVVAFHTWSAPVQVVEEGTEKVKLERQRGIAIVDPSYFEVFSAYKWLAGSPEESLSEPNQVVLTPEKVKQYFGIDQLDKAVGRSLIYKDSLLIKVSGVVERPTFSSDLDFTAFISFSTIKNSKLQHEIWLDYWKGTNSSSQLFVKLQTDIGSLQIEERLKGTKEIYLSKNEGSGSNVDYKLQALNNLHFNSEIGIFDHSGPPAHRQTLFLLSLVAILLLVIAVINFINLETAQSMRRAREVGVRKVLGGTRMTLILQFLSSTFLLTLVAVMIAITLAQWAIGVYEDFIPDGLVFELFNASTLGFIFLLIGITALVAGGYPAIVLSSFLPVLALKEKVFRVGNNRRFNLRQGLVIFQFIIAQILIFGTLTVGQQIKYMLNKDLGFDQEAIIHFYTPRRDTSNRKAVLVQELKRLTEVQAISVSASPPTQSGYSTKVMKFQKGEQELVHSVHQKFGDTAFIDVYGMKLLAGRNFSSNDSLNELLINETYAGLLGFDKPLDAVGQFFKSGETIRPIVGVVADFHLQSLHEPIKPAIIRNRANYHCINLRLHTFQGQRLGLNEAIGKVEAKWKELYPEEDLNYRFIDETIAKLYKREKQTSKLVKTATTIAILICCLGLFGLISFTTIQRTKEIGIRKILGASVVQILDILTRNFLLLVLIALLIASPMAYWLSKQWLQDFAYAIPIQWWQFVVVGLLGIGITLLTVSFHSFRAATANPVESLRQD